MADVTGVFEGGGVKGIALAGAAAAAMDTGYRITSAVGTSAGALVASLVAAGYGSSALREVVRLMPWPRLRDRRLIARLPFLGPHVALVTALGMAKGGRLESETFRLLARRGIRTFGDLPDGALRVVATDLSHGKGVVLPDDLPAFGIQPDRFPVARAIRASSAVPFFFEPVRLRNRSTGEQVLLADGALAARFPIQLADTAIPTIGFRLKPADDVHPHRTIRGPISLASSVMMAGVSAREYLPSLCRNLGCTITVQADRPPLAFDLDHTTAVGIFDDAYRQALVALGGATS